MLASILAAVIFLIAMLDNPFRGEVGAGPESIARVYETMIHPPAGATAPQSGPGTSRAGPAEPH